MAGSLRHGGCEVALTARVNAFLATGRRLTGSNAEGSTVKDETRLCRGRAAA
jgi:hypothetical protein